MQEPFLPASLEDEDPQNEAEARDWTARAIAELARQLGMMNDYYYPLIGAAGMLRVTKSE
jgi:hypothetical protein